MIYKIELSKTALKFLKKQPKNQQIRLFKAIYKLPEGDIKKLTGGVDEYRLRVGDYRIIYKMKNEVLVILVLDIGNRGQIYK
ncbi:MAG: type II toxin-antitoxin system RelE family toxin [Cellulosilyticaceae bacterium]